MYESDQLTIVEAMAMEGTPFMYIYSDGDPIEAYVKKFDPLHGLTCLTLETHTQRDKWQQASNREEDDTWCIIGHDFRNNGSNSLRRALRTLKAIRDEGEYVAGTHGMGGIASCSF